MRLLQNFYRELARQLDISFSQHRFSELVLVAEPRLLGVIRPLLSEQLRRIVRTELHKDITFETSKEIEERVRAAL
jgi:protein required for attachment to host cells